MRPEQEQAQCSAEHELTEMAKAVIDEVYRFVQEATQTLEAHNKRYVPKREIPGQLVVLDGLK